MANYWKLYKKAKAFYFGLGKIKCPALNNEEIIFDWLGFRHFLRKKGKDRPVADRIRRFMLFGRIATILEKVVILECKDQNDGTRMWSLIDRTEIESITIVVLEKSDKYYFISIMNRE